MGQLVSSVLVTLGLRTPEPTPDQVVSDALGELRNARDVLTRTAAHKRRLVKDVDARIVDLGLLMQNRLNRLAEIDAQEFRRHLRRRKVLTRSHGVFQQQLSNLESQIEALENAPALELSLRSLQSGVDARHHSSERANVIMTNVRASLATLYDDVRVQKEQHSVDDELQAMDDATLEQELQSLMQDDEFLGQFDRTALEQRRLELLAGAPSPPTTTPSSSAVGVRDVERELGLLAS